MSEADKVWQKWIDPNVENVSDLLRSRMEVGFKKYGTTTQRKDIDLLGWLQHLQEELLDAAVYIERLKKEVNLEHRDLESLDPAKRTWEYDEEGLPRDKVTGKRVEL
jgi:hypothetical protein